VLGNTLLKLGDGENFADRTKFPSRHPQAPIYSPIGEIIAPEQLLGGFFRRSAK
jgi:hypothetical protein